MNKYLRRVLGVKSEELNNKLKKLTEVNYDYQPYNLLVSNYFVFFCNESTEKDVERFNKFYKKIKKEVTAPSNLYRLALALSLYNSKSGKNFEERLNFCNQEVQYLQESNMEYFKKTDAQAEMIRKALNNNGIKKLTRRNLEELFQFTLDDYTILNSLIKQGKKKNKNRFDNLGSNVPYQTGKSKGLMSCTYYNSRKIIFNIYEMDSKEAELRYELNKSFKKSEIDDLFEKEFVKKLIQEEFNNYYFYGVIKKMNRIIKRKNNLKEVFNELIKGKGLFCDSDSLEKVLEETSISGRSFYYSKDYFNSLKTKSLTELKVRYELTKLNYPKKSIDLLSEKILNQLKEFEESYSKRYSENERIAASIALNCKESCPISIRSYWGKGGTLIKKVLREEDVEYKEDRKSKFKKMIKKWSRELNLSDRVVKNSMKLFPMHKEKDFAVLPSFAAAALYFVSDYCDENRTQQELCNKANISQATLRNKKDKIKELLNLE